MKIDSMNHYDAGQKGLGIAEKPEAMETIDRAFLPLKKKCFSPASLPAPGLTLVASLFILAPLVAQGATLEIDPTTASYDESAGTVTLEVKLTVVGFPDYGSCDVSGEMTTGGTATIDSDYTPGVDGTSSFSISAFFFGGEPQQFQTTVSIDIQEDTLSEGPETIIVSFPTLSENCSFPIDNQATATLTILDNDEGLVDLPALTETQQAVDDALDQICGSTTSEALVKQCDIINALPLESRGAALQQIAPDEVMAQGTHSVKIASTQLGNVKARLLALRNNNNKANTMLALNDFSMSVNGEALPTNTLLAAVMSDVGSSGIASDSLGYQGKLAMFLNGRINYGDKETTSRESGFDFDTNGITFGVDYRFTNQFILGGALGYATTDSDYNASGGNLDIRSLSFTLYGTLYTPKDYYLDWLFNWGTNDFDTVRNIVYSGTNTQAAGSTDGTQLGLSVNTGTNISFGEWLINPYARLEYIQSDIDTYQETGGAGLALAIGDQSVDSLTTVLATRLSLAISQNWGILTPSTYLEWEHEYKDNNRLITSRFVEDPTVSFSIPTDTVDQNYFNLGVGLSATFVNGRAAFINYEAVLGQEDISSYTIDFGVRMEF